FFFFSSRRRHTRSKRDWSSDVCSSDLEDTKSFFEYPWPLLKVANSRSLRFSQASVYPLNRNSGLFCPFSGNNFCKYPFFFFLSKSTLRWLTVMRLSKL